MDTARRVARLTPEQRHRLAHALAEQHPADAGELRLVAYVATDPRDAEHLAAQLHEKLPAAMVPSTIVPVERLPRNANGKIDRRELRRLRAEQAALTAPAEVASALSTAPTAPAAPTFANEEERQLHAIWAELLGTSQFGRDDNFFTLGGHSLLALRMTSEIQRQFGDTLPVNAVFQLPTVALLATKLVKQPIAAPSGPASAAAATGFARPAAPIDSDVLVPIQPQGGATPLFCAHCVKGRVTHYYELARALGSDQPVYGLQPPSIDGTRPIPERLSEIAQAYVREIRRVQPAGPYRLAGYSFGGMLAFEIAQQLQRGGDRVEMLALFDTILPRIESVEERSARHADRMQTLTPAQKASYLARSAFGNVGTLFWRGWKGLRELRTTLPTRYYIATGKPLPAELSEVFVSRGLSQTMWRYRAQPYDGRILLFKAGEKNWFSRELNLHGWDGIPRDGLQVEPMVGDHMAMLRPPGVQDVASRIQAYLNRPSA